MSYTKGKWVVNIWEGAVFDNHIEISCPEHKIKIAEIPYIDDESKANAKLISAAPDLLEACQKFLEVINRSQTALEHYGSAIMLAEAAILKAV